MAPPITSVAQARRVIIYNKGRHGSAVTRMTNICDVVPTKIEAKENMTGTLLAMEEGLQDLDVIIKRLKEAYEFIGASGDEELDDRLALTDEEDDLVTQHNDAVQMICNAKALAARAGIVMLQPALAAAAGQQQHTPNLRPYEGLKPKSLDKKTSADGLSQFHEAYDSYRKTGKFKLHDNVVQLQLLKGCMSEDGVTKFDQVKREHDEVPDNYEGSVAIIEGTACDMLRR